MRKYFVTYDEQGGNFGMNRAYTAYEWLDQVVEWLDSDEAFEDDQEREEFINRWRKEIELGKETDLIDYIADGWELCFEEYTSTLEKVVNWIAEHKELNKDFIEKFPELEDLY